MKKLQILLRQLFIYGIVGGVAALVEWGTYYCCDYILGLSEVLATCAAFLIATSVNWVMGRLMLFRKEDARNKNEIIEVFLVSAVGLGMNIALMLLFVNVLGIYAMVAKICATGIVFFWNFLSRRFIIYRNGLYNSENEKRC